MPRASSSFTHDLAYSFVGDSYVSIGTGKGTSYEWTIPDLASKITSATSGTLTIRCVTKNGTATVGTKTVTLTAKVPTTDAYMPSISSVTVAEQTSGVASQFGAFIQNKSKIKATITAAGAKGSTIASYSTTFAGKTYTGSSWTSGAIPQSGTLNLVTTVKDSRGRTAKNTTSITVLAYAKPKISTFVCKRTTSGGVEDPVNGTKVALAYVYSVQSLNSKNTASFKVEIKSLNGSTWSTIRTGTALSASVKTPTVLSTPTIDTNNSYDLRATLVDWFGEKATYTGSIKSGEVILDLGADGTSAAFGKTAEIAKLLDIGWGLRVLGGVQPVVLQEGTDLNSVTLPGPYVTASTKLSRYPNSPFGDGSNAMINVIPAGPAGQVLQVITTCTKTDPFTSARFYYSSSWGSWMTLSGPLGTRTLTLTSDFKPYSDSAANIPWCRKTAAGVVELRGTVSPAKADNLIADEEVVICTLPEGFRPSTRISQLCQGSTLCTWLLLIDSDGTVSAQRYRNGSTATTPNTSAWLVFHAVFIADQ
jgi:hypothetical protein